MSIFYGWKISALAMAGNIVLQGSTIYCMNAFMEPLCGLHGWSRMSLNFSLALAALTGQIAMPLAAAISQRYSLRFLMSVSALAGGLATCAMGFTSNIHLFTLYFIIVWVASQFCGGVTGNALMSNWFHHYRGLAFGLANSGTSISGIVLPFGLMIIINFYNVPTAYMVLGLATCALAPLSWIYVRQTPAVLGLHPDGADSDSPVVKTQGANVSMKALLGRPAAWGIGIAFGLTLMCGSGMVSQLKPRFSDLGLDAWAAMSLTSLAAFSATAAKYLWGWLCDRFTPIWAGRLIMLSSIASMSLLLLPPGFYTLALFSLCYSLCSGGMWVLLPAIISYYFGGSNFLAVFKFVSILIFLRCAGFPIMGMSHEYFSSYAAADIIFVCAYLVAFIIMMLLKPANAVENPARAASPVEKI